MLTQSWCHPISFRVFLRAALPLGTVDEFVLQFTCLFGSAPRKHLILGSQEWNVAGIAIPRFDGPSLSCTVANRYGG